VLRKEVALEAAIRLLDGLVASGIELREPPGNHTRAMELADQLRQDAAYDAHYLALAETLDCELWTADERFYRAANVLFQRLKWLGEFGATNEPT
jgi:predicted nucleic acid-binding protein